MLVLSRLILSRRDDSSPYVLRYQFMTVAELRAGLTDFQKEVLSEICEAFLVGDNGPSVRALHLKHGKQRTVETLRALGGSIVHESEDHQHGNRYRPTILGLFLSPKGPEYEALLVRFIEHVEKEVLAQNDRTAFKNDEIDLSLGLDKNQSRVLCRLLNESHLWSANSHNTPDGAFSWEARVVEHVDELPAWKSKQEFLARWVISAYDPKRPVFVSEARAYGSPFPIFPIGDEFPAPMPTLKPLAKRFRVALSFPGEKRAFIAQVANVLAEGLGRERVLFDDYLTAELARPNLDVYLGRLYHDDSELLVPFYCAEYEKKKWCGLEWRQMRNILLEQKDDRIMPFRFDDTPIAGVLPIDGYVSIGSRTPGEVAGLILERLAANRAKSG